MGLEPRTTGRALTPSKAYVSGMCLSHGSALCALDLLSRRRAGLGCPAVAGGFRGRSHNFSQHSCARSLGFRLQELPDLPIWILPNSARSRSGRSGVPASRGTLNKSNKNATMRWAGWLIASSRSRESAGSCRFTDLDYVEFLARYSRFAPGNGYRLLHRIGIACMPNACDGSCKMTLSLQLRRQSSSQQSLSVRIVLSACGFKVQYI